ncbi:unnamed protein product [Musa hybrid cultivar]
MVTQSSFTIPAPAVCLPAFSRSQRLLEENRLHISRYGQWHSISFARQIPSSARLFAASLNARCSATQTQSQTVRSKSATITATPTKESRKLPKLDDGNTGFPPRSGGGDGGGGGGGGSSSGGFFLFAFLVFLDYLKELEGDESLPR